MVREAENDDLSIDVDEGTDGETEEGKKRRTRLTFQEFYEALESLLEVKHKLTREYEFDDSQLPIVLIAPIDGKLTVHVLDDLPDLLDSHSMAEATGDTVDNAITALLQVLQDKVEELRKTKYMRIDELMKKSSGILRRAKSKKKEG